MVILHILSVAFEGKEMKFGLMIPLDFYWILEMYGDSLFFLLIYNVGRFATTYFWKFHVSMYILSLNMYILIDVLGLLWTMRPCSWVLSSAASSWWRGGILKTQTELQIRGGNFCTFYFHYSIWKFDSNWYFSMYISILIEIIFISIILSRNSL